MNEKQLKRRLQMNDKCFEVEDSLSSQGCFVGMNGEPRDPGSYGTTLEYDKLKDAIVKHNDDELRDFVNQYGPGRHKRRL